MNYKGLRCKVATIDEWLSGDVREDLMEIMSVVTKTEPKMLSIYEFLKEVNEEQIEEIEK